jgi:transposase
MGRPSIDPELMIRMLVVGYVFAIRSERLICREVQVNRKRRSQATALRSGFR